jgi:predicted ATPase
VKTGSNGENAFEFFLEKVRGGALYLLDEPENSLAISLQKELGKYITDSAMHFGCQFVIATHSPILLSMPDAVIYDLDEAPVSTKTWTELDNVRQYFAFFEEHRAALLEASEARCGS